LDDPGRDQQHDDTQHRADPYAVAKHMQHCATVIEASFPMKFAVSRRKGFRRRLSSLGIQTLEGRAASPPGRSQFGLARLLGGPNAARLRRQSARAKSAKPRRSQMASKPPSFQKEMLEDYPSVAASD
jgi:hypothetical protein